MECVLIGIGGGSGCGKTFLAHTVQREVGPDKVAVLSMDQYFKNTDGATDPRDVNFDHPSHLDLAQLVADLEALKQGLRVSVPSYDFRTMRSEPRSREIGPLPVVLVEGLFVLANPVLPLFDLTCFLKVEADQRLLGRIQRDLAERGGDMAHVVERYQRFVRPSYRVFVEPTAQNADVTVDFTYRRSFFIALLTHVVRDYVTNGFDFAAFVDLVKREQFSPGLRPDEGAMPLLTDILELAKAYPETACPPVRPA